ncbi:hypothetical protein, partial [Kaarinaea lacus]
MFLLFSALCLFTVNSSTGFGLWIVNVALAEEGTQEDTQAKVDAERMIDLQNTISADKEKLQNFKTDLENRKKKFKENADQLTQIKNNIEKTESELQGISDKESKAALDLAQKIDELQQEYELLKKQSDIALEAGLTVQKQIKALEQKIANDENAVKNIVGGEEAEPKPTTPRQTSPEDTDKTEQPVKKSVIPGVPILPSVESEQGQTREEPEDIHLESQEQIEARKVAEKKTQEAKKAEQVVVNYAERKINLEEQIALEDKLLDTAVESRSTLDEALAKHEEDLDRLIAEGASQDEMRKARQEISKNKKEFRDISREIQERSLRLNELHQALAALQEEQL